MATLNGGFLGELSGSVGNITFARVRGGIVTARRRAAPSNPRTARQQAQRARFKQLQRFASAMLNAGLIRAFWRPYATGRLSAYNAFVKANSAVMPDGFDPGQAVVSQGNGLDPVTITEVTADPQTPGLYTIALDPGTGQADDLIAGAAYNALTQQAVLVDVGTERGDGGLLLSVPPAWTTDDEDALFAYVFAYRVDAAGRLLLATSGAQKITAAPFEPPAPVVPPPQVQTDVPYGAQAGT